MLKKYLGQYKYIHLIGTTDQKATVDIQKIKTRKPKHNSKENHQITREETKGKTNKRRNAKITIK